MKLFCGYMVHLFYYKILGIIINSLCLDTSGTCLGDVPGGIQEHTSFASHCLLWKRVANDMPATLGGGQDSCTFGGGGARLQENRHCWNRSALTQLHIQ